MDLKDAIYNRRAVRAYTREAVGESALRDLIDAAIQAPSAMNAQPWVFCVVRDATMLADISRRAKEHMLANTPAGLLSHHLDLTLHDPTFDIFYGAPALVLICSTTDNAWAVENCALAAGNLMLAAHAAGLGTCWIGFAQSWLRSTEGKAFLRVPLTIQPVAPIIVGHPAGSTPAVPRKAAEIRWLGVEH
ncbi:nitroreductase [Dokdonella sp.]|uniref:nitroreductase family protein n=1 Tax=Dokdonella sp. TaxID=2291710 RepID=UPI002F40EF60